MEPGPSVLPSWLMTGMFVFRLTRLYDRGGLLRLREQVADGNRLAGRASSTRAPTTRILGFCS